MSNKIELTFTEFFLKEFKETFDLEVEFLQGQKIKLDNGLWYCVIFVSDEKMPMIKDFINQLMSLTTDKVKVKIGGIEVHKN